MMWPLAKMVSEFHRPDVRTEPDVWVGFVHYPKCTCGWSNPSKESKHEAENSWGYHHIRAVYHACANEAEVKLHAVNPPSEVLGRAI